MYNKCKMKNNWKWKLKWKKYVYMSIVHSRANTMPAKLRLIGETVALKSLRIFSLMKKWKFLHFLFQWKGIVKNIEVSLVTFVRFVGWFFIQMYNDNCTLASGGRGKILHTLLHISFMFQSFMDVHKVRQNRTIFFLALRWFEMKNREFFGELRKTKKNLACQKLWKPIYFLSAYSPPFITYGNVMKYEILYSISVGKKWRNLYFCVDSFCHHLFFKSWNESFAAIHDTFQNMMKVIFTWK